MQVILLPVARVCEARRSQLGASARRLLGGEAHDAGTSDRDAVAIGLNGPWWAPAPLRRLHERIGLREGGSPGLARRGEPPPVTRPAASHR